MKRLLRSCISISPSDTAQTAKLTANVRHLQESGLGFDIPEDVVLWNYIKGFVRAHDHVPTIDTVRENFVRAGETEVVDRLETVLSAMTALLKGDFLKRLEAKVNDRQQRDWELLMKQAAAISSTGLDITDGKDTRKLKGPADALRHLSEKGGQLLRPAGVPQETDITRRGDAILARYHRRKTEQEFGVYCGIQQIDEAARGLQKGQLWIHAGFTSGFKSGFAARWAYVAAAYYNRTVAYYSLEMAADELEDMLACMHSQHRRLDGLRAKLGIEGVPYVGVLDGELTAVQETLFQAALADLQSMASLRIIKPLGEMHLQTLWDHAEAIDSSDPLDMVIVDHLGLLDPLPGSGREEWQRVNANAKLARRMAQEFNQGRGVGLLCLVQINREGGKRAITQAEGSKVPRYDLAHMSGGSEIERSAYVVTTSYVDDRCRDAGVVLFDSLKGRLRGTFKPLLVGVDWTTRALLTLPPEQADPARVFDPENYGAPAATALELDQETLDDLL